MLYDDLFVNLERARWNLSRDIDWDAIEPDKLTPEWIFDVREVCLTELSALYATEMFLRDFYADIDFCSFISVWFYEEMKHHLVLRKYLERVGEVIEESELPKLRLSFDEGPAIETLTMHFCGEQRLAHWYTAFSANAPEPVLRQIFKVLAADELRHGAAYAKYLRKAVRNKPEVLPAILQDGALDDPHHQRQPQASDHGHRALGGVPCSRTPTTSAACSTCTSPAATTRPRCSGASWPSCRSWPAPSSRRCAICSPRSGRWRRRRP